MSKVGVTPGGSNLNHIEAEVDDRFGAFLRYARRERPYVTSYKQVYSYFYCYLLEELR